MYLWFTLGNKPNWGALSCLTLVFRKEHAQRSLPCPNAQPFAVTLHACISGMDDEHRHDLQPALESPYEKQRRAMNSPPCRFKNVFPSIQSAAHTR